MEIPILKEAVVIFGLSIGVILVCHRFRIPAIIGFLITGVVAGPHGLRLVGAAHEVEMLAEIGVILLLFVIGMELSFTELLRLKKPVFLGGTTQVLLTIIVFDALALLLGFSMGKAVFAGFLVALSSTAIVLKILSDRAEMSTPHGRIGLGILIFQDLIVVPMMLLVPFLTGRTGDLGSSL
ncbi:MAG: cation:proton antiporter, partial [Desulfobacteraceae bacterium]